MAYTECGSSEILEPIHAPTSDLGRGEFCLCDCEFIDDPHRLARLFYDIFGEREDDPEYDGFYRFDFFRKRWTSEIDGESKTVPLEFLKAIVRSFIRHKFEQAFLVEFGQWHERQNRFAFWRRGCQEAPKIRIVTDELVKNVINAFKSLTLRMDWKKSSDEGTNDER